MKREINIGDIVYQRFNGIVTACKCIKISTSYGVSLYDGNVLHMNYTFLTPDNRHIRGNEKSRLFASIEDAIHNENAIDVEPVDVYKLANEIVPKDRLVVKSNTSRGASIKYYKWDGYCVATYLISFYNVSFIKDENGWMFKSDLEALHGYKHTKKEALGNNVSKVLTF